MPDMPLHRSWKAPLLPEFQSAYMARLMAFLAAEETSGKQIFPPKAQWFRALELTPLDQVKVVIVGQDPYPGAGKAHGLSFSVLPGVRPPPSLLNIYKELQSDLGITPARHGFLEHWAKHGVLLLNDILTVEKGKPNSHEKKGWERFTGAILALVNEQELPVVFMLWGNKAKAKAGALNDIARGGRHLVLSTSHPSNLGGAYTKGFKGCRHFSQCNAFLESEGRTPVDWELPT